MLKQRIAGAMLLTATAVLWARAEPQGTPPRKGGAAEVEPPALRGDIKHRAVAEYPRPRDRTRFGIGEEVEHWIDPPEEPDAVIAWRVDGDADALVYPVIGPATTVTLGMEAGSFTVAAWRRDRVSAGGQAKPTATADLQKWLREQVAGLPKGERDAVEGLPSGRAYPKELPAELQQLDALRKGLKTPFDQVDELGCKLLKKYPDRLAQGQIYYMLAHVHAQSGLVHPERIAEYAQKGLALPLEPFQVPRLYVYWGDALQVGHGKKPLAERRKWSAVIYLAGLRDVLRYPLPAKAPELPATGRGIIRDIVRDKGEEEAFAKVIELRRRVEFQRTMILHRDVLTRQIAALYTRPPADYDELRQLAAGVFRDHRTVDCFLRAVKGAPWHE